METQPETSATEKLNKPWLIVMIFVLSAVIVVGIDRMHELGVVLPVMLTIYALCVMWILLLIAAGARKRKKDHMTH